MCEGSRQLQIGVCDKNVNLPKRIASFVTKNALRSLVTRYLTHDLTRYLTRDSTRYLKHVIRQTT